MADFEDFLKLDIRVGTILEALPNLEAVKTAYILKIDFGKELGIKQSSAQIAQNYSPEGLVGKQILAVVNFPPKQVAKTISEVLVLGVYTNDGVVLAVPDKDTQNGDKLG